MSAALARAELTCEQFAAGVVTDYMEGDLGSAERTLVEMHLAGCEGCSEVLERMRTVAGLLRELDADLPELDGGATTSPPDEALLERFRAWAREQSA
jgi:predicted anti-sigma-YlaC factor YlaD